MAKNNNLTDFMKDVADAIRAKRGTSDLINPQDFSAEIASIQTGDPMFMRFATKAEYVLMFENGLFTNYPNISYVEETEEVFHNKYYEPQPDSASPLYIEAAEDGMAVSFSVNSIEYSLNNVEWVSLPTSQMTPSVAKGQKIYFRASGLTPDSDNGIGTFSVTAKCYVGGNLLSMIYSSDYNSYNTAPENAFRKLFRANGYLISACRISLPSVIPVSGCISTFAICENLISAPEINCTSIGSNGFASTFYNDTNLINVQKEIPEATLSFAAFYQTYYGCSALKTAPNMKPTGFTGGNVYKRTFMNCTSLINVQEELPATGLTTSCYESMYEGCSLLEKGPALPAYGLRNIYYCYRYMFRNCTNLKYIKCLKYYYLSDWTTNWVSGVGTNGIFVKRAFTEWGVTYGSSGVPTGWTVETE